MKRTGVVSNDAAAEDAARDFLTAGGSAVGAVLCGYFAAAGGVSGVLLSPLSVLVVGIGTGGRAFDGRSRQPGSGQKRPRGFTADQEIPSAARVAVPSGATALLVAQAYDGNQKISSIMKPGIARAERGGSEARADLLRRIRAVGGGAFREPSFVRALLRVAGPSEGGLLSPADFAAQAESDVDQPARVRDLPEGVVVDAPWSDVDETEGAQGAGFVVAAVDVRGVFAAVSYRRVTGGLDVEELELELPLLAEPVQRGVSRVAPGLRVPSPTPIAVVQRAGGTVTELLASPGSTQLDLSRPTLRLSRSSATLNVDVVRA